MKIKHWQGYGIVDAKKISKRSEGGYTFLVIKVTGDHEWGLVRDDEYDLKNWLVKKFDKNFDDNKRLRYRIEPDYTRGVESCTYTFMY